MDTIDFETEPIAPYPNFPPKPVGVSIWKEGRNAPTYLAWGHPSGNNCTRDDAQRELAECWAGENHLLFHNARFDMAVAAEHFGLPWPKDPLRIHDTLYLNFLHDANADSLSLKPSAHRILGMAPEEKDELDAWLRAKGLKPGADIGKAPGDLVGRYACGDTLRTRALYDHLLPQINGAGMLAAYRREQRLAPILNENERDGVRIDLPRLRRDLEFYEKVYVRITNDLLALIGSCNPDSAGELAAALLRSGYASEDDFARTPTGKLSVAKDSIAGAVKNPTLVGILAYRGNLKTLLTTFMRPWVEKGILCGGRLHPQFHQVRGADYGARTGRMSSSDPNFQNVPNEFERTPPEGYPTLPYMRIYVLPDEGHELVSLDFRSQEFRIAAHFAEGRAAEIYRTDPKADFHEVTRGIIREQTGMDLSRKYVKIVGFSLLYGAGVGKIAESLHCDKATASRIKSAYFTALPGMKDLMDDVSKRGRQGLPVKTWGGRHIFAEPPKVQANGQYWDFSYKLINYLVQGSAADQTKEAINEVGYKTAHRRFLASVHDENVYSVDPDHRRENLEEIRAAMEKPDGWDVPWKTQTDVGPNWFEMEEVE